MKTPVLLLPEVGVVRTFLMRELRAALLNRFIYFLPTCAFATGLAPLFVDRANSGESAPFFLVQAVIYIFPLFSLLLAVGAAQADQDERPFLFTQPSGRAASMIGKFLALWGVILLSATLLVLPSALGDSAIAPLLFLWFRAALISAVFVAGGLATGFSTTDRVKAHLAGLALWIVFLAGFDLLALIGAQFPFWQGQPLLWSLVLMLNPLDALRLDSLLSLAQAPFETVGLPSFTHWWINHTSLWFFLLCTLWTLITLWWCRRAVAKVEP